MMMRSLPLERRIAALERALRGACNCRREQATGYHTLAELMAIMGISCPVHGRRALAVVVWLPPDSPLFPPDRELCLCPPNAVREWREGRRGPLTAEEREQVYARWEDQVSGEAAGRIRQDQARSRQLLHQFQRTRRKEHVTMPGNNQSRETL
jgi:hypothetical protein